MSKYVCGIDTCIYYRNHHIDGVLRPCCRGYGIIEPGQVCYRDEPNDLSSRIRAKLRALEEEQKLMEARWGGIK